jgi:uncharacterized membrane protein
VTGRRFFWLAVGVFGAGLVVSLLVLPDRVPLHFGADGTADRWGTPVRAVGEMAVVGLGVGVLMFALAMSAWRLPFDFVNIPDKEFWQRPENQRVARRRLQDDMYHVGGSLMLFLTAIQAYTVFVADDARPSIYPWGLVLAALFVAGLVVALVLRMRFYRRLPGE